MIECAPGDRRDRAGGVGQSQAIARLLQQAGVKPTLPGSSGGTDSGQARSRAAANNRKRVLGKLQAAGGVSLAQDVLRFREILIPGARHGNWTSSGLPMAGLWTHISGNF